MLYYNSAMERDAVIIMRAPADVKQALRAAALDDSRTMSNLALKVLADWLQENGYLVRKTTNAQRTRR